MAKNASKKSAAKAADWDLEQVLTVPEFFELHEVDSDKQSYLCKECEASDGSTFFALGLPNGKTYKDADGKKKAAMTFFALSNKHSDVCEDTEEFEEWLSDNKSSIALLEPPSDDVKFGKLFITGARKMWKDL